MLDGTSIGFHGINCFHLFFYMGGAGWSYHSYQNVFSHRGHGLWSQQEKKNNIEGSAFSQAGSLPVLFDRSHLGNIFGRWSGSRRTVFCEYWYPLNGTESGKLRGVGRISGVIPLLHWMGTKKGRPLPLSFSLYHLGMAYTFVLFLFSCSWIRLPAPALAYIVFGTGVVYTLERCLICPCPGWTGFFLQIFCLALASIWSVGSWDICHDQIQRGFWDYGRPSSLVLHCSGRLHLCGYC